jgi:hypothetical protein
VLTSLGSLGAIRLRRFVLVGVIVAGAGALVSCSGATAGPSSSPDSAAVTRASAALAAARQHADEVERAQRRLVESCLRGQGFSVLPPTPTPVAGKAGDIRPEALTPGEAAAHGYGFDPALNAGQKLGGSATESTAWSNVSDDYKRRLTLAQFGPDSKRVKYNTEDGGVLDMPGAGCSGTVQARLFGDLATYLKVSWIATNGISHARGDLDRDDAVRAAMPKWASCVDAKGHRGLSSPAAARDAAIKLYEEAHTADEIVRARQQERALAVADATCVSSVGLGQALQRAEERSAAAYLAGHEADLVAYREVMDLASKRAQTLLREVK